MNPAPRACAVLLLLSAGASAETINLGGQFPDAPCRNQAEVGACHAFASIALLEAAVYRAHDIRRRLSEADLFVSLTVNDPGYYSQLRFTQEGDLDFRGGEGGNLMLSLQEALKHGVAAEEQAPWSRFLQRYRAAQAAQSLALATGFDPKHVPRATTLGSAEQRASEQLAGIAAPDPVAGMPGSDYLASVYVENHKIPKRQAADRARTVLTLREYLRKAAGARAFWMEAALLDTSLGELMSARQRSADLFASLRLSPDFDGKASLSAKNDPEACRKAGRPQRDVVLRRLRQGVPVAVAMRVEGLPEWNSAGSTLSEGHGFLITGYETRAEGEVFKTRNSWGGKNPEVPATRLCRIFMIATLLTREEAKPAVVKK